MTAAYMCSGCDQPIDWRSRPFEIVRRGDNVFCNQSCVILWKLERIEMKLTDLSEHLWPAPSQEKGEGK